MLTPEAEAKLAELRAWYVPVYRDGAWGRVAMPDVRQGELLQYETPSNGVRIMRMDEPWQLPNPENGLEGPPWHWWTSLTDVTQRYAHLLP